MELSRFSRINECDFHVKPKGSAMVVPNRVHVTSNRTPISPGFFLLVTERNDIWWAMDHGQRTRRTLSKSKLTEIFSLQEKFGNMRLVEIVYEHHDIICATQEPVFLLWWRHTPTIIQAQHAFERLNSAAQSMAGGVVFIVVVGAEVSQPDRGTADFFARNARAIEKHILAHAFVLEGTGLKGTAVRTAIRAMQSVSRVIAPWTISSTVDEAVLFLAKKAGFITEPEARSLIADIAKLRATHALPKQR
jgi:hypothetical protein